MKNKAGLAKLLMIMFLLPGCSHALYGSNSLAKQEPFAQDFNTASSLQVPASLSYVEQSPIDNFWYRKTYKKGEMYYLNSMGDQKDGVFVVPAGTTLKIKRVLYHTNIAQSGIFAFGEIYVKELEKNVPFYRTLAQPVGADFILFRAPWESPEIPERRVIRTGPLCNQYLGIEK